jgi:hypothetical protein
MAGFRQCLYRRRLRLCLLLGALSSPAAAHATLLLLLLLLQCSSLPSPQQ